MLAASLRAAWDPSHICPTEMAQGLAHDWKFQEKNSEDRLKTMEDEYQNDSGRLPCTMLNHGQTTFVQRQEVSAVLVQSLLNLLRCSSQCRTALLALGPSVFDRLEELPSALTLRLLLALGAGS